MKWSGGFRLLDLILLIAILGFLGMLVPPAISHFRAHARREQCADNLRKIGCAFRAYHDANKMLPPAAVQPNRDNLWVFQGKNRYSLPATHANWMILLLPYMNHAKLYDLFDKNLPSSDPKNNVVRMAKLPEAVCPDDKFNRDDNFYLGLFLDGSEARYARGNYAINAGVSYVTIVPGSKNWPMPAGLHRETKDTQDIDWGDGIAGFNRSFSFKDFHNNLSTTVGVDEIRAGLIPQDGRGIWAMGAGGASITYAHGLYGDACGPNNRNPRSDDSLGCKEVFDKYGYDELVRQGMGCCPYRGVLQATARSMHPGGVHVMMMDQSARFVVDGVDPNLWHAMHSRETPEKISLANLEVDYAWEVPSADQLAATVNVFPGHKKNPDIPKLETSLKNSLGSKFTLIPAGKFIMGLPDEGRSAPPEWPAHEVEISKAFHMGAHEVTQGEYVKVMGKNPSWYSKEGGGAKALEAVEGVDTGRFPVEQVTWAEAAEFCRKLSALPEEIAAGRRYRLPTEAEWEYCCRCGSTTRTPTNGSPLSISEGKPVYFPVDQYPANPWGLCAMEDGVWEWCSDWYGPDYYRRSPRMEPRGPSAGIMRVPRGTAWIFHGLECLITFHQVEAWRKTRFIGFRIVCELDNTVSTEKWRPAQFR